MSRPVRVRFAPSPTGLLHIGNVHTGLFNWLFARREGGKFLLRIEDTDTKRSRPEWVDAIFDAMGWLGLDWDEDVIYQSNRIARYQERAQELLDAGKAYYCYCTPEELEARRQVALEEGRNWTEDPCAALNDARRQQFEEQGKPRAIRLAIPPGKTGFTDRILGDNEVDNSTIGDFVIVRSDGSPLYHLAVVVDDMDLQISHVIRGIGHLSNTPKHIHLFQAFGYELPEFAHLPHILGPDKKKFSKRHGAVTVVEYRDAGYLPDAMVNFLSLLGWQSGDDQEFFTRIEMLQRFSLDQVHKRDTVFDLQKFEWLNGQHIMTLSAEELLPLVAPFFVQAGVIAESDIDHQRSYMLQVIELLRDRCRTLADFAGQSKFFFVDELDYNPKAVAKHWKKDPVGVVERLRWLRDGVASLGTFSSEALEAVTRQLAETHGVKTAQLIHPCRVALTGEMAGPSLFHLIALLGKETTLIRLDRACEMVETIED